MGCLKLTYRSETPTLKVAWNSLKDNQKCCTGVYRFGFNGKEMDNEWFGSTGTVYDYGFRIYDARIAKFLSVDPLTKDYPSWTPFAFAMNTPISAIDLDGLEAIYVAFPEYKADPEIQVTIAGETYKAPKLPTGHASVLLIEKSGATRYFEYGRYPTHDETKGKVEKRYLENNIVFDKGGFPTQESLNKVMKELSTKFGQGGAIRAAYIETENVEKMLDYAWEKTKESNPKWSDKETPYNPDREPYSVYGNNCGTFAKDVIEQDENVDMPWVIITSPNNIVDDIIDKGNTEITFDPKTQKTNVIKSKKEDKTQ